MPGACTTCTPLLLFRQTGVFVQAVFSFFLIRPQKFDGTFVGLLKTVYIRRIFVHFGTDFEKYTAYTYSFQQP